MFIISLGSTLVGVAQLRRSIDEQDQERFDTAVVRVHGSIRDRLDLYVAMLRAGAGLMAAAEIRTAEQFRAWVEQLRVHERYPRTQGIGFSAPIPGDASAFETAQRSPGRPEFRVWPETPRLEFHTIQFLEPLDRRNLAAIGFNMFSDPVRRAAMSRARDTGEPVASRHRYAGAGAR